MKVELATLESVVQSAYRAGRELGLSEDAAYAAVREHVIDTLGACQRVGDELPTPLPGRWSSEEL